MAENGPCVPNEDGSDTISNKWSWTNKANVIWVRNQSIEAQIFIFHRFGIFIYAGSIFNFRLINPQELDSQVVSMSTMKMVSKKIFMDFWRNFVKYNTFPGKCVLEDADGFEELVSGLTRFDGGVLSRIKEYF